MVGGRRGVCCESLDIQQNMPRKRATRAGGQERTGGCEQNLIFSLRFPPRAARHFLLPPKARARSLERRGLFCGGKEASIERRVRGRVIPN